MGALLLSILVFAFVGSDDVEAAKIDGYFDIILPPGNGLDRWVEEFKKITGTQLTATKPPHAEYPQVLGTLFASGSFHAQ